MSLDEAFVIAGPKMWTEWDVFVFISWSSAFLQLSLPPLPAESHRPLIGCPAETMSRYAEGQLSHKRPFVFMNSTFIHQHKESRCNPCFFLIDLIECRTIIRLTHFLAFYFVGSDDGQYSILYNMYNI